MMKIKCKATLCYFYDAITKQCQKEADSLETCPLLPCKGVHVVFKQIGDFIFAEFAPSTRFYDVFGYDGTQPDEGDREFKIGEYDTFEEADNAARARMAAWGYKEEQFEMIDKGGTNNPTTYYLMDMDEDINIAIIEEHT